MHHKKREELKKLVETYLYPFCGKIVNTTEEELHDFFKIYIEKVCQIKNTIWHPDIDIKRKLYASVPKEFFPHITIPSIRFISTMKDIFLKEKRGCLPFKDIQHEQKLFPHYTVHTNTHKLIKAKLVLNIPFKNQKISNSKKYYLVPITKTIMSIYEERANRLCSVRKQRQKIF